ncbi:MULTISPECIES: type II toxin-antitoxin system RelE/ParE family toxin [unclassified Mesorhizobium]|uniref:type II toxin-antitoxin system RelE/ParE family toxin n=1 Tax=unclassified Mesorhizobium TaxID=325217 RepID=UPI003338809B
MIEVRQTDDYSDWFKSLKDIQARARILARLTRVSQGTLGDVAPVGEGVSEFRIHYGPGYRVYFTSRGTTVIILLGGGDKSTQKEDIAAANALAKKV